MLPAFLGKPGAPIAILCLGAHCDDIEIGAGGTVLRLLAERPGSTVKWVVFASTPEREAEARASAAEVLAAAGKAEVEVNRFRESYFPFLGDQIKDHFERIKAAIRPDLVLTHATIDLHQDHRTIGELTWNTFRDHLIAEYEIPKYEGDLQRPNLFVPLPRATAQRKIDGIVRHFPSQAGRRWFRPETFEALLRLRGVECNAPDGFAEAFHVRKIVV
ncbi:MAG TPA: PIG-L family deacetylase [Myxococcales bacterium]|nr:PIG-L family deacetylase [Myxococcales bacterium]